MALQAVDSILFGLRSGETVLVEYGSTSSPELLLYLICRRCGDRRRPVLLDDISDSFAEALTRLELVGLNLEGLSNVPVIKIGGNRDVGSVFGRVEVDKHSLDTKYYDRLYFSAAEQELVLNPVLGFHKFFLVIPDRELLRLIRNISTFVGRSGRAAVYLVNRDVVERSQLSGHYHLFREIATTIVSIEQSGDGYVGGVPKAADDGLRGVRIPMP
ncbi:hypothetical protein A3L08_01165 [Thermococcus pacificus]|uniref:KaiC-like domain-containing protein n=1 Tax=Thermococcus pacificus TaxID=71998 RepID=A0A218PA13_9EURY|nr:hypothetical protein A3L08_01165 [Thermococcus pacificus]